MTAVLPPGDVQRRQVEPEYGCGVGVVPYSTSAVAKSGAAVDVAFETHDAANLLEVARSGFNCAMPLRPAWRAALYPSSTETC